MRFLTNLDLQLSRLSPRLVLVWSCLAVFVVEGIDYVTGYEVSLSLLYLAPIGLAAWYAGRRPGYAIAALSCLGWYVADWAAGSEYSSTVIPVWNAIVRLALFVIVAHLLSALRTSLRRQQHLARTDGLTGLYVRRAFEERFLHDLALAGRRQAPLSLAYLDVDDFKAINDTHGHAAGDRVLSVLGHVLGRSVRESDTAARLGGDEFALLLPDTDEHAVQQAIANIRRELERALTETDLQVTCSIGVVTFVDAATSFEEATAAADVLMYRVKNRGKGSVAFHVAGRSDLSRRRFRGSSSSASAPASLDQ